MYYSACKRRFVPGRKQAIALTLTLVLTLLVGLVASFSGQASPAAGYTLERIQLSAGGGAVSGGGYQLSGAASGNLGGSLSGGRYRLQGGVFTSPVHVVYLPLVKR